MGFPVGSVVKNLPANAGDVGLISGLGRSPGEGNGNSLRYYCLGNHMDRGVGLRGKAGGGARVTAGPGKSHGQGSLVGYSPWTWLSD